MSDAVFVWTWGDALGSAMCGAAALVWLALLAARAWWRLVCTMRGHRWERRERVQLQYGSAFVPGRHVCRRCKSIRL